MDNTNNQPLENEDTIKVNGEETSFHDTDEYKEMLAEDIEKIMEEAEAVPDPEEETEVLEALDEKVMIPIELDLDVVEEPPEIFYKEEKENKMKLWPLILITLVFAILLIFTRCSNTALLGGEAELPTAGFTYYYSEGVLIFADESTAADGVEIIEYEWNIFRDDVFYFESPQAKFGIKNPKSDAVYEIRYRVKDSNGNWSDYKSEKFDGKDIILAASDSTEDPTTDEPSEASEPSEPVDTASTRERLDNYTITKSTDNIINDYDNNPRGDYSLKLALEDNNDFAAFSLDGIFMDDDVSISFQIKTSDLNDKIITIKGMNQDDTVFTMTKEYTPKNINNWELFYDNVTVKNGDKLVIEVSGSGTVWLDDISIKAYK